MANCGQEDSNSSQFYITLCKCPWLDDCHVVFGEVINGQHIIDLIGKHGTKKGKCKKKVVISDCGKMGHKEIVQAEYDLA